MPGVAGISLIRPTAGITTVPPCLDLGLLRSPPCVISTMVIAYGGIPSRMVALAMCFPNRMFCTVLIASRVLCPMLITARPAAWGVMLVKRLADRW